VTARSRILLNRWPWPSGSTPARLIGVVADSERDREHHPDDKQGTKTGSQAGVPFGSDEVGDSPNRGTDNHSCPSCHKTPPRARHRHSPIPNPRQNIIDFCDATKYR
jgi:hypothetical protein